MIDDEFREHTVLSIIHRLDTVFDFDRVVVMEKGCVVEIGKPRDLLTSRSKFRALWDARLSSRNGSEKMVEE